MEASQTTDQTPFAMVAGALQETVDAALPLLRAMSDSQVSQPWAPGKWTPRQIIGHLIDSASNNHQRFVRAQEGGALVFPAYAQEHWVTCQHYESCGWNELVSLWHGYNHHVAHVIAHIPEEMRGVQCLIGTYPPATLVFLAQDYLVHLRHHLTQIQALP